jgi:hypothetical protein
MRAYSLKPPKVVVWALKKCENEGTTKAGGGFKVWTFQLMASFLQDRSIIIRGDERKEPLYDFGPIPFLLRKLTSEGSSPQFRSLPGFILIYIVLILIFFIKQNAEI